MMKKKIVSFIITAGVILLIVGYIITYNLRYMNTIDATLHYTIFEPVRGSTGITEAEIGNFTKSSLISAIFPSLEWGVPNQMLANISIFCDSELVYEYMDAFRIFEGSFVDREVMIKNLPPGGICRLEIDLICDRCPSGPQWVIDKFKVVDI